MRRILIQVVSLSVLFFGCKSSQEKSSGLNGLQKFYYPDGKLYLEGTYIDSVAHGDFKQYFKNGNVYEKAHYVNGVQYGVTVRYYEDGKLSMEIPYDSGRVHGVQKKYRQDGTLAYEAPYHYNYPCVGLKEYYTTGRLVDKLPEIVIREEDKMWSDNRYSLHLSISNGMRAEFFRGELTDGKYIGSGVENIYMESDGTARIDYHVGLGMMVMEKINIIAKVKSDLKNYYIVQKQFNMAVQNR
jgi:antitoxin component YwqK of YwqJK toxin-antitoxin module